MPAGTAGADLGLPKRLARLRSFPQRKIASAVFVVFVHVHARAVGHAGKIFLRQLAVLRELGDPEIIRAILGAVGETLFLKPLDEMRHLLNVVGGADQKLRMLDVQGIRIFQESFLVLGGVLLDTDAVARRVADDFVIHVGDVHHVLQLVAALQQEAPQRVHHDEGAEVADVSVVVNRWPAGVHADQVVFQRAELLDFCGQSVKELKRHRAFSRASGESSIVGGCEKRGQGRPLKIG